MVRAKKLEPRPSRIAKTTRAAILLVFTKRDTVKVNCLKLVIGALHRVQVKDHIYCVDF